MNTDWEPGPAGPRRSRWETFWNVLGVTVVALLSFGGLLYVGFIVLAVISLHQWAQNK